jgi:hypothetical protein
VTCELADVLADAADRLVLVACRRAAWQYKLLIVTCELKLQGTRSIFGLSLRGDKKNYFEMTNL